VPTYEYACTECGDQSEVVQKFTDDPLTVCKVCGGRLRKVFSPVGIVFKGAGFYRTDSRAAAKEPVGATQKPNGSEPAAKPSGDSKSGEPSAPGAKGGASGNGSPAGSGSGSGASSGNGSSGSGSSGGSPSGGTSSSAKVA